MEEESEPHTPILKKKGVYMMVPSPTENETEKYGKINTKKSKLTITIMATVILGLVIIITVLLGKDMLVNTEENSDELSTLEDIVKYQEKIIRAQENVKSMDMRSRRNLDGQQDRELVTDMDRQIPEFFFDCLAKNDPWISPCNHFRRYLMIFDQHGNFFQEMINRNDNSTYLRTSFMKTARKPMGNQMIQAIGYPKYLFQFERADVGSFYIATKSGQLLVAGNGINPSLLLREDHCSLGKYVPEIMGNSSTSTTESPVTISSTDSPVTSAITESPVTAVAISTPAPSLDYGCDQSLWRLWKVDGRFLLIESKSKPGFFLNVESRSHKVGLGMEEKMTGIQTSFLSKITLERTAGQAEPGIGDQAYGDVKVHYVQRDGTHNYGYICDYEWGEKSADSVCKHLGYETGIPTYDGRYSNTITPDYAVSGLKCDDENLNECQFRTSCGPTLSCMTQNSMMEFGGKGYACNRGKSTDVAGVVCGNQTQINNVLKEEVTCNRTSLNNDRKGVAAMFSIQKQMKTVTSTMFENNHWSEYLLPMPMAVSLMSALLLVSSQNDREIKLVKPAQGYWDYLKFDNLQPNLLFLSHNVKENFVLSNANMGVIKVNTRTIHRNMKHALQNAFSSSTFDYKTLLPRNLRHIAEDAKTNKEKAEEVHAAFKKTNQIIDELLQGLKNTEVFAQTQEVDALQALEVLSSEYERNEKELEENLKKKQEYEEKVTESRKAFFNATKVAMNTQCVDEVTECNSCALEVPQKTKECKPGKTEKVCREWNDPICLATDKVCLPDKSEKVCNEENDPVCLVHDKVCKSGKSEKVCREWNDPICLVHDKVCKSNKSEKVCQDWNDPICLVEENACKPGKSEQVCEEWNDPICLVEENTCTGGWTDKHCKNWVSQCQSWFLGICSDYDDVCEEWEDPKCKKYEIICKENSPNSTCASYVLNCNEYEKVCTTYSTNKTCKLWDVICHEYEPICKQSSPDATCKNWDVLCHEYEQVCKQHSEVKTCKTWDVICHEHKQVCKQYSPDTTCKSYEFLCHEYVYKPTVRGSYCQDNDKRDKLCTRCKWIDGVLKNMENVADISLKMQNSVLNDESSYSAVEGVITELVSHVNTIEKDVQNYKKWKSVSKIVPPINNFTQAMNNGSQQISQIDPLVDKAKGKESQPNKLETEANKNIDKKLKLTKLSVNMVIDLLSQEKIQIAKKSHSVAMEFKDILENLITRKVNRIGEMSEEEQIVISTIFTKGKALLQEAIELKEKHEISIPKDSGSGAADHKTGDFAANHLEYLTKRHKTEKIIESLSNRMSTGIREMFTNTRETQDINSVIKKLVQCSRYLNFLTEQWVQLRTFFQKLSNLLEIMHKRIKRMSETYLDLGGNIPRSKLTKAFKDTLQREIVDALANNIYVGRIASYYTKIAEDGLLQRMSSIGTFLTGPVNSKVMLERLKKFIEDESIMTQNRIKAEVSKEEAKINDAIMRDVSSMKNDLACKIKDAENLPAETRTAITTIMESQNAQDNVVTTTRIASQSDIDEMNFFDDVTVDLDENVKAIDNIEIFNDEMDYWDV